MKPRRRSIIKIIALLLAWLVAGAALNVAVAWGCVLIADQSIDPFEEPGGITSEIRGDNIESMRSVLQWRRQGEIGGNLRRELQASGWKPRTDDDNPMDGRFSELVGITWRTIGAAYHDYVELPPPHPTRFPAHHSAAREQDAGWPFTSLTGRLVNQAETGLYAEWRRFNVIEIDNWPSDRSLLLPYGISWPGFAINTLFYAAVLWLLFAGPFALRRMIRRRRGQCQRCAYPIGTNERCTECGAAVTPTGDARPVPAEALP